MKSLLRITIRFNYKSNKLVDYYQVKLKSTLKIK